MDEQNEDEAASMSRRRVLRATLGTGAVAAAWSAPQVKSLAITPRYAAAMTVPTGTVMGANVIPVGVRACNNANSEDYPVPGLPGAVFTIVNKLCQNNFNFDWSITAGCTVTGMYCDPTAAANGFPFTQGFVAGSGQTGVSNLTGYPQTTGGLWIDVVCP